MKFSAKVAVACLAASTTAPTHASVSVLPRTDGDFSIDGIIDEVIESERLAVGEYDLSFEADVTIGMLIRADGEQIFRVVSNLVRNARQAIMATHRPGLITVRAFEDEAAWRIIVEDNGPGLPAKAREHLFTPFQGGIRKGGTGLGLAIAAELARGHGGRLDLLASDHTGTKFAIRIPKGDSALDAVSS